MRAEILLESDPAIARAIEGALAPETARPVPGTEVRVEARDDGVHLDIAAEDLPSLRAALHSYVRFARTAKEVQAARE